MMSLASFIQFEQKEYVGVVISGVVTVFAMSIPLWVPRMLSKEDSSKERNE